MSGTLTRNVVAAALLAILLAGGQQALASDKLDKLDVTIYNKLSVDMTDGQVVHRQNIRLETDPPKTIPAGQSGEFKTEGGDSFNDLHLKVQYTVGSETVEFGFRVNNDFRFGCFTDTPSDISDSYHDCDQHDPSFEFSPN